MSTWGSSFIRALLSFLICFQIAFAPVIAHTQTSTPPPADIEALIEKSEAQQAEELKILEEKEHIAKQLHENLLGGNKANPLDYFSLLRQDFIEKNKANRRVTPASVVFRALDDNENIVREFRARDSLYAKFDGYIKNGAETFQIVIDGWVVHQFRVPIEALAVLGDYIVFIEKESYNRIENFRHISFIDLNYFRLNQAELPIFKAPIEGVEKLYTFEVDADKLKVNGKVFESGYFDFVTQMQRVIFNISVNLTEPKHLSRVINHLEPFLDYFNENLKAAKDAHDNERFQQDLQRSVDERLRHLEAMKNNADQISEEKLQLLAESFEKPLAESFEKARNGINAQRGLIGRTSALWQRMTIPRPAEPGKLKEKIVAVAVGTVMSRVSTVDAYELAFMLAHNKKVRYTAATVAAAAASYFYPEQTLAFLYASLEMVFTLGSTVVGKTGDFVDLMFQTAKATAAGLNPVKLYEVYLADGAWRRTAVGVTSLFSIVGLVIGIPHLIVNSYYLVKDMKNSQLGVKWDLPERLPFFYGFTKTFQYYSIKQNAVDFKTYLSVLTKQFIPNFIARQKNLQQAYLNALAEEEKEKEARQRNANTDITEIPVEELYRQVREFLDKMNSLAEDQEAIRKFTLRSRIWGAITLFVEVNLPQVNYAGSLVKEKWKRFQNIESFAGAVGHFLFSFASFTKSGIFYATVWNYFYLARLLVFKPRTALTFMMYPNLFRRSVATQLGSITPPSFWNGGTRWIWQEASVRLDAISDKEYFDNMKKFESEVVEVEKRINKEALAHSLKALQRYFDYDTNKVLKLSASKITNKLTTVDVANLSADARIFFLAYYDSLVERSMREYLFHVQDVTRVEGANRDTSTIDLKKWFILNEQEINVDYIDEKELVKQQAKDPKLYDNAYDLVHKNRNIAAKHAKDSLHKVVRGLDPESDPKIGRFIKAGLQMRKPSAMARAVKANIAAILVDKPMELALLFIAVAGITDGPNQPLWNEMFSENSAFYLSRNVFMGYISGFILSIFADVWVKIQQDMRLDRLGDFMKVPEGEFANKRFRSWYVEQFRHNPQNKWWDHHKEFAMIIYHNLGPALVLYMLTGYATLGRLDLDFYFLGYFVAFMLPFSGLGMKIEQTFEIASGWVLRHVPKHLRNHPLIIEWANKEIMKLRVGFQVYYKLYENVLGQFISNLMALTTARNGTRAISRILFGGKTITEHLIEKTTASANSGIPGMNMVDRACRLLFAGNYTSGPLPPAPK